METYAPSQIIYGNEDSQSLACLGTLAQFYFVDGMIHMVSLAAVQNKKKTNMINKLRPTQP